MIVLISGKQGSGKTTLTKELLEALGMVRVEFRFAKVIYDIHDKIREMINDFGIETPEHVKVKDGKLLQFLGTELGRNTYGEDVWVRITRRIVDTLIEKYGNYPQPLLIVVSDCRFKNEFEAFPEALRVRLECVKEVRKGRCEQWRDTDTHPSETDLDDHVYAGKFDLIFDTEFTDASQVSTKILQVLKDGNWVGKRK